MKTRTRTAIGLLAALLWLPAAAQDADDTLLLSVDAPSDSAESETGDEAPEDLGDPSLHGYWERRLANARQRIGMAQQRVEKAVAEYSRARHDRYPRGEALAEIKEKRVAAENELQAAEAALPRLVEQARQAGVPSGILQDYWEE